MKKHLTKVTFFLLTILVLVVSSLTPSISPQAAPISEHPRTFCYSQYSNYKGWGTILGNNKIAINYKYTQKGENYYGYRQILAGEEWSSHFGFFNIKEVTSDHNLLVTSDNYGDTGWVGRAYYTRSPKDILINEWYHINQSNYDFTAYERTAIHELGHAHGLDHTSCTREIMSNHKDRNIKQIDLGDGDVSGIRAIYYMWDGGIITEFPLITH